MSSVPLLIWWSSISENELKIPLTPEITFTVEKDGLRPWPGPHDPGAAGHFEVATCRFGGDSADDFHPAVTRFVNTLKRNGAKPHFERDEDGPNFAFMFDISSGRNVTYYEIATGNHGQEIVTAVFCRQLDSTVVENVHQIDAALHLLIKQCGVPEIRHPALN
jgi:hypothetical protein